MSDKCKKCGKVSVGYMKFHCNKCKRKMAGPKPKKSKDLCSGCRNMFYNDKYRNTKNISGTKGCWSYKTSKVVRGNVYYSLNQVIPNVKWKLNCYMRKY